MMKLFLIMYKIILFIINFTEIFLKKSLNIALEYK